MHSDVDNDLRCAPSRASSGRQLLVVMLFGGLGYASLLCSPAIATQLSSQLHYSADEVGLFFSSEYAGYMLAGLLGKFLLPRMDWRRVGFFSVLGYAFGTALTTTLLGHFHVLLAVRLLTAACSAMLCAVALSSANQHPNPSRAVGLFIMGQLVFGVAGLAVMPFLFTHFGLQAFFLAIVGLLLIFAWATKLLAAGSADGPAADIANVQYAAGQWLRFPAVLLFYIALSGIWTFAGQIGKDSGIAANHVGWILSVATGAGLVGAGFASWMGGGFSSVRPLLFGYATLILCGLALLNANHVGWYIVALIGFKFAWTFVIPLIFVVIGRLDSGGRRMAEITLVAGIGLALGPILAGRMILWNKSYGAMLVIEAVFLLLSGASAIQLVLTQSRTTRSLP